MSSESDKAARITAKGLRIIDQMLDVLEKVPYDDWSKTHVRDVSDCVMAAVKVQAEERAQLEFEEGAKLSPEDIRALLKEYLAALPQAEYAALVAEARAAQPSEVRA